jgi:hypothetical protein
MICINDYKNLKIGDQIIIINGDYYNIKPGTIYIFTGQESIRSTFILYFSDIEGKNPRQIGLYKNDAFSKICFMYFREKNLNELLNK